MSSEASSQPDLPPYSEPWPSNLVISHKLGSELTDQDIQEFKSFLIDERNELKKIDFLDPKNFEQVESSMNNDLALRHLREGKQFPESVYTFVHDAADGNKVMGVSLTLIHQVDDHPEGFSMHIGLGWVYQHKGLGTSILRHHIDELKKKRVTTVIARVWDASRRLIEKLNIPYTEDPADPGLLVLHLQQ